MDRNIHPLRPASEVSDRVDRSVRVDGRRGFVVSDSATEKLPAQVTGLTVVAWARPDAAGWSERSGCVVAFNTADGGNENMICYDTKKSMFSIKTVKRTSTWELESVVFLLPVPGTTLPLQLTAITTASYMSTQNRKPHSVVSAAVNTSRFSMGQEWDGSSVNLRASNHFAGAIDEVAIFDKVLTQDELKAAFGVVHLEIKSQTGLMLFSVQ